MSPFAIFDKSTVTGVNEVIANGGFEIYPNPVSDNLNIQNNSGSTGLLYANIYNILGEIVGTYTISNTNTSIPVDRLTRGQYFIKLYNDKTTVVEKFIKM